MSQEIIDLYLRLHLGEITLLVINGLQHQFFCALIHPHIPSDMGTEISHHEEAVFAVVPVSIVSHLANHVDGFPGTDVAKDISNLIIPVIIELLFLFITLSSHLS